ncbi:MAG TPA: RimK-like ATPgrasp N-terminal domain-containing protein, partial [Kiloniellales bacterium]|nr:RimK-like ATPgrasp N-terminal domain-containing protein [Kiloniellales bacterium]
MATAVTAREYITGQVKPAGKQVRVVNLSDDFEYLDVGYYCSLLAEARGHKVIPTVETVIDLTRKTLYEAALPDLNAALRRDVDKLAHAPQAGFSLIACFGQAFDGRFGRFARSLFDRFRCPLLRVQVSHEERWQVRSIAPVTPGDLSPHEFEFFLAALEGYTRAHWRTPKVKAPPRHSLAILQNPRESLPPSNP